jgi:hypothetical protein
MKTMRNVSVAFALMALTNEALELDTGNVLSGL